MPPSTKKEVLISGASIAGLSTAFWMNRLGYQVTIVEIAPAIRKGGTPVNIQENTIAIVERMGLLDQIRAHRLTMEVMEFKNAAGVTEKSIQREPGQPGEEEYEIERDVLLTLLHAAVKDDVTLIFENHIVSLKEQGSGVEVVFHDGQKGRYDLVFGCDGIHSLVRKECFGPEASFSQFMQTYFSITIVDKLLIRENTTQMYSEPGRMVMLNAYNGKTDIVLCFRSDQEIPHDYRDEAEQRRLIFDRFSSVGWRTPELLDEVRNSPTFYFDKLCQIKIPSWTKGRIALVGDAAYCASPAAGRGGSLAIDGAAALADAFEQCHGDFELAFLEYNRSFRSFIEQVQADAVNFGLQMLMPGTEEAIRERNTAEGNPF